MQWDRRSLSRGRATQSGQGAECMRWATHIPVAINERHDVVASKRVVRGEADRGGLKNEQQIKQCQGHDACTGRVPCSAALEKRARETIVVW